MGSRQKATVDINPEAIMQALKNADYSASAASRIIGMADNYISSLCRYGAGNADVVARLAHLCRVDYETLLKKNPATEDPEPATLPEVGGADGCEDLRTASKN